MSIQITIAKEHQGPHSGVVLFRNDKEEVRLKAEVTKKLFDSTSEGASIAVRYVPGNPKVALLEGEY